RHYRFFNPSLVFFTIGRVGCSSSINKMSEKREVNTIVVDRFQKVRNGDCFLHLLRVRLSLSTLGTIFVYYSRKFLCRNFFRVCFPQLLTASSVVFSRMAISRIGRSSITYVCTH